MPSTLRFCDDDIGGQDIHETTRVRSRGFRSTFIASAAAAQTPAPNCAGARDIRLVNGKIVTMDANNSIVSEVTIQDGVITGVGKSSGRLSPCTRSST